jgi:hypothetical protein
MKRSVSPKTCAACINKKKKELEFQNVTTKVGGEEEKNERAFKDGFGGLVVSVLASGSRVQTRPKPLDFSEFRKIHSTPSYGGEVK